MSSDRRFDRVDLVSSYPSMVQSYETLGFTDNLDDEKKISEISWVIHTLNKFISQTETECKGKNDKFIHGLALKKMADKQFKVETRKDLLYSMYKQTFLEGLLIDEDDYEYISSVEEGEDNE